MTNSPQPKTWRDVLPIHPAAELFPLMSAEEICELGVDIEGGGADGLRYPITLVEWTDSPVKVAGEPVALLDGRNRLDALENFGYEIRFTDGGIWCATSEDRETVGIDLSSCRTDPYGYVISANLRRRHLTAKQKRELIGKLLKAKPEASNVQIAKQVKADDKTVAKVRKELEVRSEIPNVETRTDTKGRKQPSTKIKKSEPAAPHIVELDRNNYSEVPAASAKPTSPVKTDPIGSPPVRYSEVPATSVSPQSRPQSVSAKDIELEDFSARAMELVRLTRNKGAKRFAKTAVSDEDIIHLFKLFTNLVRIRQRSGLTRQSAEVSTEQPKAQHAPHGVAS
jgi:hypothetical protein